MAKDTMELLKRTLCARTHTGRLVVTQRGEESEEMCMLAHESGIILKSDLECVPG